MHCLSNTIAIACIVYIILNESASLMSLSNTYKMPAKLQARIIKNTI